MIAIGGKYSRMAGLSTTVGEFGIEERPTFTCGHCQRLITILAGEDPSDVGMRCKVCMEIICIPCANKIECVPWEKEMERREKKARAIASYGV
ncbi:MAG: hypothetical protein V3W44_08600 [Dehalococcoidales bacterium]